MDHRGRRAAFDGHYRRGDSRRTERADVPADQRQPCWLRQAGKPQRPRHARGSNQQNQDFAGEAFLYLHTGDITHLSKLSEFDDADRILSQARSDVHYVPGEHDIAASQEVLGEPKIKHAASHLALLTSVAGSRGKCRNGEYPIDQDRSHPIRTKSLSQTVSGSPGWKAYGQLISLRHLQEPSARRWFLQPNPGRLDG
jgi:hypothetical protein